MTTITTTCAGCGRQLAIPERYRGRDLKCPGCGHPFRVEAASADVERPPVAQATRQAPPPEVAPNAPAAAPTAAPADAAGPFADLFTAPPAEAQKGHEEAEPAATVETGPVYWRLKRVGVLSAAFVTGAIYLVLGLLFGIAVAVASIFLPAPAIPFVGGRLVGGLAIVVLPLLYGAGGLVVGALTALLYNVTARFVGGVRLLLE